MRAARLRRVLLLVRNMTVLLSAGRIRPSLGGIGEGVVEGVEGVVGRDRELEAISDASVLGGCAFDRPTDRVAAGATGGERGAVAEWALVPLERGKDDTALLRLVVVVQQVVGHAARLPPRCRPD